MSRRRAAAWLSGLVCMGLVSASVACARPKTQTGDPQSPRGSDKGDKPVNTVSLLPEVIKLGWLVQPHETKARARADNQSGRQALEAGNLESALALLESALSSDPDYDWARYNRACALACLGRELEALPELFVLMQQDLPRFGVRIMHDEVLESMRAGPYGEALEAFHALVGRAYAEAIASGVAAWTYHPRSDLNPRTESVQAPYQDLRLGIYDPIEARFIPLSPDHSIALGGMLDRQAGRLLMISGEIIEPQGHEAQPRSIGVHLYDLAELGAPLVDQRRVDSRRPPTDGPRRAIAAAVEDDHVRLSYYDLGARPNTLSAHVGAKKLELLGQTWHDGTDINQAERGQEHHVRAEQPHVYIDGHGAAQHQPLAQIELRGAKVHVEGREQTLTLAAEHRINPSHTRTQRSADGRYLMILDQHASCEERGRGARVEHALSRFDLDTGETQLLAHGPGMAGAELGDDGWVYYGLGSKVKSFAPDRSEAQREPPEGVYFTLPGYAYGCATAGPSG